jgi:hypothetical protein
MLVEEWRSGVGSAGRVYAAWRGARDHCAQRGARSRGRLLDRDRERVGARWMAMDARGVLSATVISSARCISSAIAPRCRMASRSPQRRKLRCAPPTRLSAQDQFLRRLGPTPVGAVHSRARHLRNQRDRAHPPALGWTTTIVRIVPASKIDTMIGMSRIAAEYGLDVWSGIRRSRDYSNRRRRVRAEGVGRGLSQAAADRCGVSFPAAIRATRTPSI